MYPHQAQLARTMRDKVLTDYERFGKAYEVNTKPYHSTLPLQLDVVDVDAANQVAFAVARRQTLNFFSYGVGERVTMGNTNFERRATEADTNLSRPKSTNGAADVILEAISFSCRGYRVQDAGLSDSPQEPFLSAGVLADPDVVAAVAGRGPMVDPGSLYFPPQVYSPFNLEDAFFNGLLGYMSCEIEWDSRRTEKLGALDVMPQGGARSLLRSNGVPDTKNFLCIEEGYIWARDGQPDSELVVKASVDESVVFPLVLNNDPATPADTVVPSYIFVDVVCRLRGLELELPSGN